MYDIEHCDVVTGNNVAHFTKEINEYLSKGYVLLPSFANITNNTASIYIAFVGKPRASSNKELRL